MDTTLVRGFLSSVSYLLSRIKQHTAGVESEPPTHTSLHDDPCYTTTTTTTQQLFPRSSSSPSRVAPCTPKAAAPCHDAREPRWVRPLGYCEKLMTSAHRFGCMTTVYALWLDARQTIDFDVIKHATTIMYRKMPHLRVVLGRHQGKLWWREMEVPLVDVKELVTDDVVTTLEALLRRRYCMEEGPLWFVRFVSLNLDGECTRDRNHNEKYKYACIFGFHHNVSDGTTNMKFCKVFLQVLNDLLQGKDIDICEEGTFAEPLHDRIADMATSQWSLFTLFLSRFYKGVLSYGAYISNFTRLFQMPAHNDAATRVLQYELDDITSKKLYLRCKMEGVTLNSAFTAAANLALYRMMSSKSDSLDITDINCVQAINMRRYWPKQLQPNTFGCHISTLDVGFRTERRNLEEFWEYSRQVHSDLAHHLTTTQRALSVQPISERLKLVIGSNFWLDQVGLPSTNDNHYCVTNMGNLNSTFPGTGEEVEVSKVLRSVSCHFMPTLCQHTVQTFRGRFCYSLDYYTQKMKRETASQYAQDIIDTLISSIHTPN
ncbi:uncharacterized protein LOC121878391 isoform X2 [Homarus americanus]|uniref:uncharacterized protein LOC121878391 isoform X2 n=1 Tax=Homarus americanus TaxID=6706 RepID=UPI001C483D98|nr:uncharacterized protein LOC121878391 isoform X2 [Homarus americanus]